MPKDADWASEDSKENVNPLAIGSGIDKKYDRAHDVVRSTVKDISGGFDYDRTLEAESDDEPAPARSTPTRTASMMDPGSPSRSAADGRAVEETGSGSGSESESPAEGDDDMIAVKSTTKIKSPPKGGSKKRKADSNETEITSTSRAGLRTRTPAQQAPFKAEKIAYSITRATGRNVSRAEVEKQLKKERKAPQAKAKAKATSNKSSKGQQVESDESSSEESVSASNHVSSERVNDEYKLQHTTLRITVAGSAEGGIEVSLAHFATLTELIAFINQRWGRVKQSKVDHLECQRPWKGKDSDLTMFEGWDEQFDAMLSSVHDAPVWRKKSSFQRTLEVKITATLVEGSP